MLSIGAAVVDAGLAFFIMSRPQITPFHVTMDGIAVGVAIASMHYIGMESMRMPALIDYEPRRFVLSNVMLQNLLSNAWKFTAKSPAPRIEFSSCEVDGRTVFSIRDNGAGFNMEHAN